MRTRTLALSLGLCILTAVAQMSSLVVVFVQTPSDVETCQSMDVSWLISYNASASDPTAINNAIDATNIGIWATNVGVDQAPLQQTTTQPATTTTPATTAAASSSSVSPSPVVALDGLIGARSDLLSRQSPTTVSQNITGTPIQLLPPNGARITWPTVSLPSGQNYVIYLASLPGSVGGLDIYAQSAPFAVSAGLTNGCIAMAALSSSATASGSAPTSTDPPQSTGIVGAGNVGSSSGGGTNKGAIAGGVLGGIVLLAVLALLAFCIKRKKRKDHYIRERHNSFLPSSAGGIVSPRLSATPEKVATPPGSPTRSPSTPTKYGGILAAIGVTTPATAAVGARRKPHRSHTSETYLANTLAHSPGTTAEGTGRDSSMFNRGSYGDVGTADDAANRASVAQSSVHSRKSSSIATFAQSMHASYPNYSSGADDVGAMVGGRRPSQRSSRSASARHRAPGAAEEYQLSPVSSSGSPVAAQGQGWTGPSSLPVGAAQPTAITGAEFNPLYTNPGVSPFVDPSLEAGGLSRTTSASTRPVTRKKAPQLPPDAELLAPANIHDDENSSTSSRSINRSSPIAIPAQRSSTDAYTGRRSSDIFGGSPPGGGFEGFAGAKEGPVHLLMPDMPANQV